MEKELAMARKAAEEIGAKKQMDSQLKKKDMEVHQAKSMAETLQKKFYDLQAENVELEETANKQKKEILELKMQLKKYDQSA